MSIQKNVFAVYQQEGELIRFLGDIPEAHRDTLCNFIKLLSQPVHGNSQPVIVTDVNEAEAQKWRAPFGKAQVICKGQSFTSALAASIACGFLNNEVGQHLWKEKHAGRVPSVALRGVTFRYKRDLPK